MLVHLILNRLISPVLEYCLAERGRISFIDSVKRTVNKPSPARVTQFGISANLIASVLCLAGPNFCTRPFPSFRWVKKPRSLAERKAGVIQPDDVAICWPFLMVKGFRPHESEKARRVGNQCRFFGARTIVTERHTENSPSPPPVRYSGRFFSRTALAVGEGRERVGNDKVRLPFHTKSVVTRSRGGTFGPKREFTFTPNFVRSGKVSPLGSTRGRETQRKSSWVIGEASPRLDPRTRARTRGEARARRSQRRD